MPRPRAPRRRSWSTPGIDETATRSPRPRWTNSGWTRSSGASGVRGRGRGARPCDASAAGARLRAERRDRPGLGHCVISRRAPRALNHAPSSRILGNEVDAQPRRPGSPGPSLGRCRRRACARSERLPRRATAPPIRSRAGSRPRARAARARCRSADRHRAVRVDDVDGRSTRAKLVRERALRDLRLRRSTRAPASGSSPSAISAAAKRSGMNAGSTPSHGRASPWPGRLAATRARTPGTTLDRPTAFALVKTIQSWSPRSTSSRAPCRPRAVRPRSAARLQPPRRASSARRAGRRARARHDDPLAGERALSHERPEDRLRARVARVARETLADLPASSLRDPDDLAPVRRGHGLSR